jgi:hypothetical protein
MLRRTPLKPKAKRKSAAMKRFHDWVARQGCCVCGAEATIHHVSSDGFKRIARSDWLVVGLCPFHHFIQWNSKTSVEAMGHAKFCAHWNVDLLQVANDNPAEFERMAA